MATTAGTDEDAVTTPFTIATDDAFVKLSPAEAIVAPAVTPPFAVRVPDPLCCMPTPPEPPVIIPLMTQVVADPVHVIPFAPVPPVTVPLMVTPVLEETPTALGPPVTFPVIVTVPEELTPIPAAFVLLADDTFPVMLHVAPALFTRTPAPVVPPFTFAVMLTVLDPADCVTPTALVTPPLIPPGAVIVVIPPTPLRFMALPLDVVVDAEMARLVPLMTVVPDVCEHVRIVDPVDAVIAVLTVMFLTALDVTRPPAIADPFAEFVSVSIVMS